MVVQTRPQIPGARFTLDGVEFVADGHGLALTTVATPGIYELAISSPTIEVEGASHAFSGWTGGERASSRSLEVGSFTLLEAGFNTTRDVLFRFTDPSGTAIEPSRVDHATIVESDGDNRYRISGDQPTRVMATRAVPIETGVALQPASYRLVEAVVDGKQVYGPESEIKVGLNPVVGIPIALPAAAREVPAEPRASAGRPGDESGGPMPWSVLAIMIGLLSGLFAVVSGLWLWRSNLMGLGDRWGAFLVPLEIRRRALRPQTERPGDAVRQPPEQVDTEWPLDVDHHLRVLMKSGRIIDGRTRPISHTIDNQDLTLFRVETVYDQNGNEIANSPQDVFLLRSQVERIEHIEAPTDPPVIQPSAEVISLEGNNVEETKSSSKESIDLRETTSIRQTHPQRSKDRFG